MSANELFSDFIFAAQDFARDECGAVTVDMMPVMMFSVSLGVTVVGEVADGTRGMSVGISTQIEYGRPAGSDGNDPKIFGALEGWGPVAGPTDVADAGDTNGSDSSPTPGAGNPGNDRDVGNAGENPNGNGGWGSGSRGRSDG